MIDEYLDQDFQIRLFGADLGKSKLQIMLLFPQAVNFRHNTMALALVANGVFHYFTHRRKRVLLEPSQA